MEAMEGSMKWHSMNRQSKYKSHDCHMNVYIHDGTGALTHFSCLHVVNRATAGGGVHR